MLKHITKAVLAVFFSSAAVFAASPEDLNVALKKAANDDDLGFTRGSFVAAPIPFKNAMIGAGLALGGGYMFQLDESSDTSILGLGAMRSENGSSAFGLMGNLAFSQNKWQLSVAAGKADLFYDLYLGNLAVPIRQDGHLFNSTLLYGLTDELHVGAGLRYLETTIDYATSGGFPPLPDTDLEMGVLSALAKWDTRDDTFSARTGHLINATLSYGEILNQSDRSYTKASALYTGYQPLGPSNSLAYRAAACRSASDAPFFEKCSLGGTDAFRGFSATRYLDDALLSAQVEFRQDLSSRFSAVAFAGVGLTGPDFDSLFSSPLRSAGGLGLRFQLSKKFKAVFSVDMSVNDEHEDILYIYVGQRF
ncbi:BamA/TamA family outer membrane protein [Shimia haliotis]|uniref:Surface antigen n=1 Tax=Shimia haliotis TaxID=1280847 RepID=A0A1I4AMX8_9RHOB|nr:BamA/TamA family outer membrane protein [Shimia haliotis]SFK57872.1 Surface antigen [Shimia haliotis]